MSSSAELGYSLIPGWTDYIQQEPSEKQLAFLMLPHREALFGGAAGGGKSSALLMAALQFVDIPFYSAILFRRTLTDLQQPEGLLTRAFEWLSPFPEVKYIPSLHCFVFPSGARLTFGYLGSYTAWEHYQGSAYQFVGFDELTQFPETDYKEMMSRCRKVQCPLHGGRVIDGKKAPLPDDPLCDQCLMYGPLSRIPIRIRSTSNPGGRGHFWVKARWKLHSTKAGLWISGEPQRPFISSTHLDNAYLDTESYGKQLDELSEARRAQLKEGDWDKVDTGLYKPEWFNEYRYHHLYISTNTLGNPECTETCLESSLRKYLIVDVAMSVRTGTADKVFYKDRQPSWTVIGAFGITPKGRLLVLDIKRFQTESPHLFPVLRQMTQKWQPLYIGMDANGPGKPIAQLAYSDGLPVKELTTHFDKIANSAEAQLHAKRGSIYLPADDSLHFAPQGLDVAWKRDFIGELMVWTGHPHDTDDQVDVLSNACHEYTLLCGALSRDRLLGAHQSQIPTTATWDSKRLFIQDQQAPHQFIPY